MHKNLSWLLLFIQFRIRKTMKIGEVIRRCRIYVYLRGQSLYHGDSRLGKFIIVNLFMRDLTIASGRAEPEGRSAGCQT